MSWFDELEARLEQQLEAFLANNPEQDALLRDQEARDQQAQLIGRRLQLQQEAERLRAELLQRADEIRQWRQRLERARSAGAHELAERAEAHLTALMEQGRLQWQQLETLGQHAQQANAGAANTDLERDWAAFETEQELETLRRARP